MVLIGEQNAAVLAVGETVIRYPRSLRQGDVHCSLIPLGQTAQGVTSTGLRWNLDEHTLEFGQDVSTSNVMEDDEVAITSPDPLIFVIDYFH